MLTSIRTYAILPGLALAALTLSTPAIHADEAKVVPALAGIWKAKELKVPASSDLDAQVWGKGASKVRNVHLALEANGMGILRIQSSVVDPQGRPKKFSQSVIEARLSVAEPPAGGDRIQPAVTVVSAEERYLDDPKDVRRIEGLKVKLDLMNMGSKDLNIFYETADGNGSFGESLQRQRPARATASHTADGSPAHRRG